MAGRHEGELARERSQRRTRNAINERLALLAHTLFVNYQQMASRMEAKLDPVMGDALNDLCSHTLPFERAALDDLGGSDGNRLGLCVGRLALKPPPKFAAARLSAVAAAAISAEPSHFALGGPSGKPSGSDRNSVCARGNMRSHR